MLRAHRLLLGHRQRHLQHAAYLAQIPRPRVLLEQRQHLAAQPGPLGRFAVLLPQLLEQRLFVGTFTQRRQLQGQAADAVIQILAKAPGLYPFA